MGLATIDLHSHKVQAKLYKIPKFGVLNRPRRSSFSKDHRGKTEVPDPLVAGDLISYKLNDIQKLARLIT